MAKEGWRGVGLVLAACGLVTAAAFTLAQGVEGSPPQQRDDARLCRGDPDGRPPLI